VTSRPISAYSREVRSALPAAAFAPVPTRLVWLAAHLTIITLGIVAIARGVGGWWAAPLWSLLVGHSFAGCAFVGHETLHGAVVRHKRLRHVVGWICFLPFTLSPRLWVAWHNRVHHGHTGQVDVDPDAYPTLEQYRHSRLAQVADYFSVGRGRWFGFLTLALGFTGQSTQMLWRWARQSGELDTAERRSAILETLLGLGVWLALAFLVGPARFVFAFLLPLVVANAIVVTYILTNHSLSPLTDVNDPLLNSLTVTTPRLVSWMHLDFGLHVEHHLFPSMSSKHAPLVRRELIARWPDRYQSLPLLTAVRRLMTTGRIYSQPTELVDPRSGLAFPTLQPGSEATARNTNQARSRGAAGRTNDHANIIVAAISMKSNGNV
jgi:fatty acid desaturase